MNRAQGNYFSSGELLEIWYTFSRNSVDKPRNITNGKCTIKFFTVIRRPKSLIIVRHRKNLPATIGKTEYSYYRLNHLHNLNGPAYVNRSPFVYVPSYTYWIDGKQYSKEDWEKERLKYIVE